MLFPAAADLSFESLDRARRDLGLGATVSIVPDPSWRALAERFREERGWPAVERPEGLERAFPLLSVVIVTWNNHAMNRLCLESLFARTEWPNLEVIVVDNGSTDGTPGLLTELASRHPNLRVIALPENRGFPAACNAGLAEAGGDYLALLNNDTVVTRGWAAALVGHLVRDRKLGLVGPVTNAIANEARIDVGYGNLRTARLVPRLGPRARRRGVRDPDARVLLRPPRREVFAAVGPSTSASGPGCSRTATTTAACAAGFEVRCARDALRPPLAEGLVPPARQGRVLPALRGEPKEVRREVGKR